MKTSPSCVVLGSGLALVLAAFACSSPAPDADPRPSIHPLSTNRSIVGLGGKCVDVSGAQTADGTKIQLWDCTATVAQDWTFESGRLVGLGGKCLDVAGAQAGNGVAVVLWTCNGQANQRWRVEGTQIVSWDGRCLDVTGSSSASGTPLQVWECTGGANQQWSVGSAALAGNSSPPPPPSSPSPPSSPPTPVKPIDPRCGATGTMGDTLGFAQDLGHDAAAVGKTLDAIASFGAHWARLYWDWSYSESTQGSGNYAFVKTISDAAHARGIKLLVVGTGTPGWASGGGWNAPPTAAHEADFGQFIAHLVTQGGADAVEVWNEPNNGGFWNAPRDAAKEARLIIAAYAAVKAVSPSTPVITGGLTAVDVRPADYFRTMMGVPGFAHSFDGVGFHPYTQPHDPIDTVGNPDGLLTAQIPEIQRMLDTAGVGGKPFWLTEFGTPTGGPGSVDEGQQATYYKHYFQGFDSLRAKGVHIANVFAYTLYDWAQKNPSSEEPYFGLLHSDGTPKPAAAVVKSYAATKCP